MTFTPEDVKRLVPEATGLPLLEVLPSIDVSSDAVLERLKLFSDLILVTRARLEVAVEALERIQNWTRYPGDEAEEALAQIKEMK